jgi:hypothetical protein
MSRKMIFGILAFTISIVSCQKYDSGANNNNSDKDLSTNLMAVVADVSTMQAGNECIADIQSVSLMKFGRGPGHFGEMYKIPGIPGMPMKFMDPRISSCATITVSDSAYPQTITIDYGSGCSYGRGHTKKGKIIIEISDSLIAAGSLKLIKTEDFYIDSMKVDLEASVQNMGKNSAGNWVIASNYRQSMISKTGNSISETYSDTTEWTSGFETIDKSDDIFYKTGSGVKIVNDTIRYSHAIIKPILYDRTCEYIKSGVINITRKTDNIVINYGDGACDSSAEVTTNGTTETIDLSTQKFKENCRFGKHDGGKFGKRHRGKDF